MKRDSVTRNHINLKRKVQKIKDYQRLVMQVASDLGVSRQHVWAVVNGARWSGRVAKALADRIERIDKAAA